LLTQRDAVGAADVACHPYFIAFDGGYGKQKG
jgi:hypothetical protein